MNNLRSINKGAVKLWQMLNRSAHMNMLYRRPLTYSAYHESHLKMVWHYPKSMLPYQQIGLWCKSILFSSNLWSVLHSQRSFATKFRKMIFDKFGRKIDSSSQCTSADKDKMGILSKSCAPKYVSSSRVNKYIERSLRDPVPLTLESARSKEARKLYLEKKYLGQENNDPRSKSIAFPTSNKNKITIPKQKIDQTENRVRSERDDLKLLLADLLVKKPKLNKSYNFEYVKTSPIFKLMAQSAERRNSLRGKSFQKQLEIPNFLQHPREQYDNRKLNVTRRTTLFPVESQFEKRTKQALKEKLCFLLQDGKDFNDDVD